MDATLTSEQATSLAFSVLMHDLRDYVSRLQRPRVQDAAWTAHAQRSGASLRSRLDALSQELTEAQGRLKTSMEEMRGALDAYLETLEAKPSVKQARQSWHTLSLRYETMLESARAHRLAKKVRQAHLKPTNYVRSVFHALSGLTGALLYHFVLTRNQALVVLLTGATIFATLEVSRRLSKRWNDFLVDRAFGLIARPFERHHTNSSSYFLLALTLSVLLFPKTAVEAGVLVLAFADPIATLIGKRYGRRKLIRDKSYAGTAAFFVTAALVLAIFAGLACPAWPLWQQAAFTVCVAFVGTVTEALTTRLDDNFTIPILAALASWPFLLF